MSRVDRAPEIVMDFDRVVDHRVGHAAGDADGRILGIVSALDVLERSPVIGRPVEAEKRELVIGRAHAST